MNPLILPKGRTDAGKAVRYGIDHKTLHRYVREMQRRAA